MEEALKTVQPAHFSYFPGKHWAVFDSKLASGPWRNKIGPHSIEICSRPERSHQKPYWERKVIESKELLARFTTDVI